MSNSGAASPSRAVRFSLITQLRRGVAIPQKRASRVIPVDFHARDYRASERETPRLTRCRGVFATQNFDNSSFILIREFAFPKTLCSVTNLSSNEHVINNYCRQHAAYHNFAIYIPLRGNQHVSLRRRCFRHETGRHVSS